MTRGAIPLLLPLVLALVAIPGRADPPAAPTLRAEAVARCIARTIPRGGQFFAAGDGSFRVVSFGPRGKAAEWTVRGGPDGPTVTRQGGSAGIDRALKGTCY